jgi:diadenosine tetraphosphate (Ap4A) HIT family hydrolase
MSAGENAAGPQGSSLEGWRRERGEVLSRIQNLRRQGVCYICRDLETQEVFGEQHVIYEDDLFRLVLEMYPRVEGHTIVVYKPHRDDLSDLSEEEAGVVFEMCVATVKAIKDALGAEKVYLLSMCDGPINHLNFQLMPRYPGNLMGYRRLAMERRPLQQGAETAGLIRKALFALVEGQQEPQEPEPAEPKGKRTARKKPAPEEETPGE